MGPVKIECVYYVIRNVGNFGNKKQELNWFPCGCEMCKLSAHTLEYACPYLVHMHWMSLLSAHALSMHIHFSAYALSPFLVYMHWVCLSILSAHTLEYACPYLVHMHWMSLLSAHALSMHIHFSAYALSPFLVYMHWVCLSILSASPYLVHMYWVCMSILSAHALNVLTSCTCTEYACPYFVHVHS